MTHNPNSHTAAATDRRLPVAAALTILGAALLLAATLPGAAMGATEPVDEPIVCGTLITEDTTLTNDVGPCVMGGLWISGDDITLDLNGHTVFGAPVGTTHVGIDPLKLDPEEDDLGVGEAWHSFDAAPVGIMSWGNEGVTIKNGTVTGFDGGVVVRNGSDHVLRDLAVRDNGHGRVHLNPRVYGEGIALWNASNNLVEDNTITGNGPYAQIAFPYGSTDNVIRNNELDGEAATSPVSTAGTPSGILLEGPGANDNVIEDNTIVNNGEAGIRLHKYSCSTGNMVRDNHIANTGTALTDDAAGAGDDGPRGDGIDAGCPTVGNVFEGNTIVDNRGHGLWLGEEANVNDIDANTVNGNGEDGLHVSAGAFDNLLTENDGADNGGFDGFDGNEDCGTNEWTANVFGTANQSCVEDDDDDNEGPGRSGEAPEGRDDAPGEVPGRSESTGRDR